MHLVGGEKGGTGKSLVAKLLAQLWIDHGTPWVGFDTDRSSGTFARSYADFVRCIEITRVAQLDGAVEALAEGVHEVVVDLAPQSEVALWRWLRWGEVLDLLEQLQHAIWFWYVIDDTRDSVLRLEQAIERVGRAGRIVCVANRGRGGDFRLFEDSKLRSRIEQLGGAVLSLPELHSESMRKIDHHDKSLWAAIHNEDPGDGPCLTLMERQRTRTFVRDVHSAFGDLLASVERMGA